jgi:chloramphenicol-sensitive protein RarD|tara:strand:+ start:716 stop:1594 length:879 start_codon:yes stop_codon:yes gene_type:complete
MKISNFNKGIISSSLGSFWWGVFGTYYFQYITFIGFFEVVVHRSIWTCAILLFTTTFFKKWNLFKKILKNKKNLFVLILTSILIFGNWTVWIYAVSTNRIIDASFGYFIFPILSVFFGYIFLKEKLNKKRVISISLVIIATIYLLISFSSLPWVGLSVAFMWSTYNLLRKKINIETDIGLLIESLFILPIAILFFYFIVQANQNDFSLSSPSLMVIIFLTGPMTVIPLYLYVKGVELSGLGPSGMIFFMAPTGQFLLGFFYYNEAFSLNKLISFIIIWIAVSIYLKDLYENT